METGEAIGWLLLLLAIWQGIEFLNAIDQKTKDPDGGDRPGPNEQRK